MKSLRVNLVLGLIIIFLIHVPAAAHASENSDRTGSPYFFIQSDDPDVDRLPLKSTSADVTVSGVIADVTVTQAYVNDGKRPIEAIYVFPASSRAAVYAMKMTIGTRTIVADVRKREDARQAYEQAKQEGRSASLLEQQRPNVFSMHVANILPHDRIVVELRYTELLVPVDKEYEFVYPTVVGPRYVSDSKSSQTPAEEWTANPYLREGRPAPYDFDIRLRISAGLAIRDIVCPSHKTTIEYKGRSQALVSLDRSEKAGGNRDFICRYRLAGEKIESGLLLSRGEKENFFLLMVQPPRRLSAQEIPPRDYVFIVDVSGSMHGFPLSISKKLLSDLIGSLRTSDRFNVMLFSGGSRMMSEQSVPATSENIRRAIALIDNEQGGGGTELLPALNRALAMPGSKGFSRTFIIATDGYVSVEAEAFDLIRKNLNRANMFAFGIGTSVNRHLIEGMAHMGMGEPFIITSPEGAARTAEKFRRLVSSPALTSISIDFGGFDVYDVEPTSIPDLLSDRPITVFGKWRGTPHGRIQVSGMTGDDRCTRTIDVKAADTSNPALRYLWARHRIAVLSDYNLLRADDGRVKEVTSLGLTYNLLTAYTSFVAIDTERRLKGEKATTVRQPLPLPEGVSDLAVGGMACTKAMAPSAGGHLSQPQAEAKEECVSDRVKTKGSSITDAELRLVKVSSSKGADTGMVRKTLEANMAKICACIIRNAPGGEIVISFEIDSRGRASGITPARAVKDLDKCLREVFQTMKFPWARDGRLGKVTCVFAVQER